MYYTDLARIFAGVTSATAMRVTTQHNLAKKITSNNQSERHAN